MTLLTLSSFTSLNIHQYITRIENQTWGDVMSIQPHHQLIHITYDDRLASTYVGGYFHSVSSHLLLSSRRRSPA